MLLDVKDPRHLLNFPEEKADHAIFQAKLKKLVPWFRDYPLKHFPISINLKLITEGLLSHLRIIQGDLAILGIRESTPNDRDLILVQ